MLEKLQPFVDQQLARIVQQDEIQFIYDISGELVGEIHMDEGQLQRIDFYDVDALMEQGVPLTNSAMMDAIVRPNHALFEIEAKEISTIAWRIKEALDNRNLKLDVIVDFDANYLATFEEVEPRYRLALPNSGLQLSIKRDGTLASATFMHEHYTVQYPETMISPEEAKVILLQQPLMQLAIHMENAWHYVYVPAYDMYGVGVDGHVKKMSEWPEMIGFGYDVLPEVHIEEPLEILLLGGREGSVEYTEQEAERYWDVIIDEALQQSTVEQPFIRACQALKYAVGESYEKYRFERTPNTASIYNYAPFYVDEVENDYTTYRFVYEHQGIYLSEKASEIVVHNETGHIQSMVISTIPYEQLNELPKPMITLEEANAIVKQYVDVALTVERVDLGNNIYSLMYSIDYPHSPTGGHIESINAYTGAITYVETGFVPIDEES
ncbi:hypothetical protein AAGS61_07670 [Lysinibacillus sp. KU-BSD001]|uniref:hypothetical protein n=1 Tax=Lysinibacillus sp. KU-BSD001 TaxID=3141328 RepID=UPI0036ED2F9C